jgi:serine/threonine-protein kinase
MGEPGASEIDVGTVVGGTYQVDKLIGRGGMGAVWGASHTRLPGKRVAIKVLLSGVIGDEVYARFRREAEIASRIGHPNIVEVLDWNTLPSGTPYLVLEFLNGESMAGRLKKGPIPLGPALDILRQIGSALNAAHRAGVVHRDLKPENIFLCPSDSGGVLTDHVKVLDFGISKIKNSTTVQTQEARILGTPQYMAPEQASGKNAEIDQRTDVFALGAIAYEMFTGKAAFEGDNLAMVVYKVVFEEPEALETLVPQLPPQVIASVKRAMSKKSADRYPDVSTMIAEMTGRPLHTLDKVPVQKPPADAAYLPTQNTDLGNQATIDSGNRSVPSLAAGQVMPVTPSQGGTATTPVPPPSSPKKSKAPLLIAAAIVVAGGIVAVPLAMKGGSKSSGGGPAAAPASTATASTMAAIPSMTGAVSALNALAPTLSAVASIAPVTSAAASMAAVPAPASAAPSSAATVAVVKPEHPPAQSSAVSKAAPAPSSPEPEGIAGDEDVKAARDMIEAGDWDAAFRKANHFIGKYPDVAYTIQAKARCAQGQLSGAKGAYNNIKSPVARKKVLEFCALHDLTLE